MRRNKKRDRIMVALILSSLLAIVLLVYLATSAIDAHVARQPTPTAHWAPPGWVSPTAPPPSSN